MKFRSFTSILLVPACAAARAVGCYEHRNGSDWLVIGKDVGDVIIVVRRHNLGSGEGMPCARRCACLLVAHKEVKDEREVEIPVSIVLILNKSLTSLMFTRDSKLCHRGWGDCMGNCN